MLLKRLELNGFKSFSGKTVLDFPEGVTAIVGPNGSGKSNVIDAIRWLLGERDTRNLRGGKTEDLIFAGTDSKPRSGMATAAIFFDNSSKFFPVDFEEVEIKREVSRDGNSRYFINKAEVRLRDLIELLSKSRLGTKGLIIIGQGNSDLFIKATPSERREMIEEMLGLREFRIKRLEAERRLKNTGFNIEKIKALIEEIHPHLRVLKRQTSKWEKRGEIEGNLTELENDFFGSQFGKFYEESLKIDPGVDKVDREISGARKDLKELEEKLKVIENSRPEAREEEKVILLRKEEILKSRGELEKEMGGADARIEMLEEEKKESGQEVDSRKLVSFAKSFYEEAKRLVQGEIGIEEARAFIGKLAKEGTVIFSQGTSGLEERIKDLKKKREGIIEKAKELDGELEEITKREREMREGLNQFADKFRKAFDLVDEKRRRVEELEAERNRLLLDKERWQMKLDDLKGLVRQAGRSWEDFSKKRQTNNFSESELAEMERKIFRLRGELAAMGEVDENLVKEAKETEERHTFLVEQLADLDRAADDLKKMIKELTNKIQIEFNSALEEINGEFDGFFKAMFKGGRARMKLMKPRIKKEDSSEEGSGEGGSDILVEPQEKEEVEAGIELDINLPKKKLTGLDVLSGGERSLVSIAALFALVSISPPPFLVLDEIDAPLDENNALRFAKMISDFSKKVQFVVVTHNRATMEAADVLYGVTLEKNGVSKMVSLKMTE